MAWNIVDWSVQRPNTPFESDEDQETERSGVSSIFREANVVRPLLLHPLQTTHAHTHAHKVPEQQEPPRTLNMRMQIVRPNLQFPQAALSEPSSSTSDVRISASRSGVRGVVIQNTTPLALSDSIKAASHATASANHRNTTRGMKLATLERLAEQSVNISPLHRLRPITHQHYHHHHQQQRQHRREHVVAGSLEEGEDRVVTPSVINKTSAVGFKRKGVDSARVRSKASSGSVRCYASQMAKLEQRWFRVNDEASDCRQPHSQQPQQRFSIVMLGPERPVTTHSASATRPPSNIRPAAGRPLTASPRINLEGTAANSLLSPCVLVNSEQDRANLHSNSSDHKLEITAISKQKREKVSFVDVETQHQSRKKSASLSSSRVSPFGNKSSSTSSSSSCSSASPTSLAPRSTSSPARNIKAFVDEPAFRMMSPRTIQRLDESRKLRKIAEASNEEAESVRVAAEAQQDRNCNAFYSNLLRTSAVNRSKNSVFASRFSCVSPPAHHFSCSSLRSLSPRSPIGAASSSSASPVFFGGDSATLLPGKSASFSTGLSRFNRKVSLESINESYDETLVDRI